MIRVIGANPAMDRISTWPPVQMGQVNRARSVSVVPGGKGFNVARAIVRLGMPAAAYGFLGGHVGQALREMIVADGVIDRHTTIAAGTRVCFILVEPDPARSTVLNEPGPAVTADEVDRFLAGFGADLVPDDLVILSGSLPDSVASAVAGRIVDIGRDAGVRVMVDIHGEALKVAAARRPWMLKCNRHELLGLLDLADADVEMPLPELGSRMQAVRDRGIDVVVVTLGPAGALVADHGGIVHARVPAIHEVNPTGSGDLLLAGLAVAIERGGEPRDAILLGAACGTAGATQLKPELPPGFDPLEWMSHIAVTQLVAPS